VGREGGGQVIGPASDSVSPSDPVARIPGVGSKRGEAYERLGVRTVADLLRLAPRRFEDRRTPTDAASLVPGGEATWVGRVASCRAFRARGGLSIVEAVGEDESGVVKARWFNQPYMARSLPTGARVLFHGAVKSSSKAKGALALAGRPEFASPAVERLPDDPAEAHPGVGRFVPVHPLTVGLSAAGVRRAVWTALRAADAVEDPLPEGLRREADLATVAESLRAMHFPDDLAAAEAARRRFAFDELIVHELLLARRRRARAAIPGAALRFSPTLHARIRRRIPFVLTPGQETAVGEIVSDLSRDVPMNRLLQGDVGAGKTVVAAYAALACVANGRQAAILAPTEILARQHGATLREVLKGSRVRLLEVTGAMKARERAAAARAIARGEADLVVGTHAVLSEDVEFARLGLVVVDEQHKFGVRQRRTLVTRAGGPVPHALVMTATPIPRTLAMVVYGDLDLSIVEGRPPGRGPTETVVVRASQGAAVMARVREELAKRRQAFVVYPLVEESDRIGLRDATAGRERWAAALRGVRVGLVHGKMKAAERAAAMESFRRGRTQVLVATVVVEVGIDVPNATVLVVEHAERFGLSQLHQLRGRVGRGAGGGLCVLVDRSTAGTPARLEVLAATDDGFRIAEEDLRLRGAGDLFGTRQHGAPAFRAARLPDDLPLLLRARDVASRLVATDPSLGADDLARLRERLVAREREIGDPSAGG
jgi:ATP-dependent DNA helicase RecG